MATRDLYSDLRGDQSLAAQTRTATANGAQVDLQGAESAVAVFDLGAYTDGTHTLDIEEAPDDGTGSPGTWSAVADADLQFDTNDAAVTADGQVVFDAAGDTGVYTIGYSGEERFLRVVIASLSGVTNGATYGASVVADDSRHRPENDIQRT